MRKKIITAVIALTLLTTLSGCLAVAAGAGAGYIYKDQQQKGKVP